MPPHHEFGWHRARSSLSPGWKHPHPRLRGHPQPPPRPPTPCGHHAAVGLGAAEPFKGREPSTNGFHVCGGEWGHGEGGGERWERGTGNRDREYWGWRMGESGMGTGRNGNGDWKQWEWRVGKSRRGAGGALGMGSTGEQTQQWRCWECAVPDPEPPSPASPMAACPQALQPHRIHHPTVPNNSDPIASLIPVSPTP